MKVLLKVSALCLFVVLFVACTGKTNKKSGDTSDKPDWSFAENNDGLELPDSFLVVVVADDVGKARDIAIRKNGDMYVSLNTPKDGHPLVALRDTTGDGVADIIKYFGNLGGGTGIKIHEGYLYFGSDTAVVRYKLSAGKLLPESEPELVVSLFEQRMHQARSLAFDNKGNMFVNIGAPSNACQVKDRTKGSPGQKPCPLLKQYAAVWQFDANTLNQTQENGGTRFVTGVRNCVALDWNPNSGNLYALMHGRDQLHTLYPDHYSEKESAELPAEEFLLLKKDANYGWPYVYWDQNKDEFMVAPEYGGDGEKVSTENYEKPIMAFPGHWAPNGLQFYEGNQFPEKYRNGAFIAFHGSWNRAPKPQRGYKVVFVPFDGALPSGEAETFIDGFTGQSSAIASPGDAVHRPCGVSEGPDGSLYITDDSGGSIFRIVYIGKEKS
ncbi:MAG TPA: PQQ-dependent sugar dehydrogenase [Chitinophagaceae bacterium]|nr:PQQ-dependent sugar dehydrogenase [Chitinophagaceae bacterium]